MTTCLYCKKSFEPDKKTRKFCSTSCSSSYYWQNNSKPSNVKCAYCQKPFYKSASKIALSKSGLFFCCREHKDVAQKIDSGVDFSANSTDGSWSYRGRAIEAHGAKCNRCGWDKHIAGITVHHIDHNRSNNNLSNLEILCACCHAIEHWS